MIQGGNWWRCLYPNSSLIFFFCLTLCLIKRHCITENEKYNENVDELNARPQKVTEIAFSIKERKEWK
jgi:hypothetical protein